MRYFVTGGAGFIGSNYIREKASTELENDFIVLDALTYAGRITNLKGVLDYANVTFIEGNILDRGLVASLIEPGDYVVNFAAESHVDRSINSGFEFVETNVLGTQVLLDASMKVGIKRFVQISTDEVYGSIEFDSWDESYPLKPSSPYSASKAAADLLALSYYNTYNLDVCITRCSNNYGPHQYPEKLIPFFIKKLLSGDNVPVYGNGQNIREWIHVQDHCRAIDLVLQRGVSGGIYNIGSGEHFTNLAIANLIIEELGLSSNKISFVQDRAGHDFRYSLDSDKIFQDLGFKPKIKFLDGLRNTIEWYKTHPESLGV
jgi:dTDP-glucose 4,6-dehydratase